MKNMLLKLSVITLALSSTLFNESHAGQEGHGGNATILSIYSEIDELIIKLSADLNDKKNPADYILRNTLEKLQSTVKSVSVLALKSDKITDPKISVSPKGISINLATWHTLTNSKRKSYLYSALIGISENKTETQIESDLKDIDAFIRAGHDLTYYLSTDGNLLSHLISKDKFKTAVHETILILEDSLTLNQVEKDAINYENRGIIRLRRELGKKESSIFTSLVFHEYAGVLGEHEAENYPLSRVTLEHYRNILKLNRTEGLNINCKTFMNSIPKHLLQDGEAHTPQEISIEALGPGVFEFVLTDNRYKRDYPSFKVLLPMKDSKLKAALTASNPNCDFFELYTPEQTAVLLYSEATALVAPRYLVMKYKKSGSGPHSADIILKEITQNNDIITGFNNTALKCNKADSEIQNSKRDKLLSIVDYIHSLTP